MKPCPFCQTANDDTSKQCTLCGRLIDSLVLKAGSHGQKTLSGNTAVLQHGSSASAMPRHSASLDALFAKEPKLVIGRAPDCDICLQHPSVSRYHALLERGPDGLKLTDLGSVNGIHLDGKRLPAPVVVRDQQRVGIGPFLFTLHGNTIRSLDNSRKMRLEARVLDKEVPVPGGQRKLLDNITFVIEPGEFVSLLGPSGSGKSTLMDCLNGRRRATGGKVLANGEDFYQHFDNFRQSLGYVPQKDIVHTQLTVERALLYTAQLRLPTDTDDAERRSRVEEVLREMELIPHRNTLVGQLSGGQIKRVSLGAELLARPCMLYIDEATSGLDAGTEARMMRLFRQLADEGRSIVCITHNVDNVDRCHLIIVLARGKLMYYGPPSEATAYFGVPRISEIYDRLQAKDPDDWAREFRETSLHKEFVVRRLEMKSALVPSSDDIEISPEENAPEHVEPFLHSLAGAEAPLPSKGPLLAQKLHELSEAAERAKALVKPASEQWHQFKVLTRRYIELIRTDPKSMRLILLQAPIVAAFILLGFIGKSYEMEIPATRQLTEQEREVLSQAREVLRSQNPDQLTDEQRAVLASHGIGDTSNTKEQLQLLDLLLDSKVPIIPYKKIINPAYTYMLLFIVAIVVLWFGCSNAAKEIVKEAPIYGRERAVNLRIVPYLTSKFLVLSIIGAIQALLLMVVLYGTLEVCHLVFDHQMPPEQYHLSYPAQYGLLVLLSMTGVALGLLLSACVNNPDQANALLPYVLIPQMILGGGIINVTEGVLKWLAMGVSPIYWAFRGIRRGATELPDTSPFYVDYDDSVWITCVALLVQTFILMALTAWFLKRQDAR